MFANFERFTIETSEATINLVKSGVGDPVLLLHGYPQTHAMWHKIAPLLSQNFTVVVPDLRGYGDSAKPTGKPDHSNYSKRSLAQDQVEVMSQLGFSTFSVVGHDRGARVAHRLALDHSQRVDRLALLDIVPTYTMFATTDQEFATAYYHWFFLIQPNNLPETLIGANPDFYLQNCLKQWSRDFSAFTPDAIAEYLRCFRNPATIHATCEDYRAAITIDLIHDEQDLDQKIQCPLLVLWGGKGLIGRKYNVLATWQERAIQVDGQPLACGHFLPEEAPAETYQCLNQFLKPS
jgi:haloacetate dehalogenase